MQYLDQLYAKYLQYSLNKPVQQSGQALLNGGRVGSAKPFAREIVLSKSANLSTLAEEVIHFEQLFTRGMWGVPKTAQNMARLEAIKPALETSAKKVLRLGGFVVP